MNDAEMVCYDIAKLPEEIEKAAYKLARTYNAGQNSIMNVYLDSDNDSPEFETFKKYFMSLEDAHLGEYDDEVLVYVWW